MKQTLIDLEQRVDDALVTDDRSGIEVLGYGEISTVLGATVDGRSYACKRLPPFPEGAIDRYRTACTAYLVALGERGIRTATSTPVASPISRAALRSFAEQAALWMEPPMMC